MPNIDYYLQQIKTAVYGEEVRGAIHDAISECASAYDDITEFRSHINGNRSLVQDPVYLSGKAVYGDGVGRQGTFVNSAGFVVIVLPVSSSLIGQKITYTCHAVTASSAIGMCFWDGLNPTTDAPYGSAVGGQRVKANTGSATEWVTADITVPAGSAYMGFTWRTSLGIENFNIMLASDYVRTLEGRVRVLEQIIESMGQG